MKEFFQKKSVAITITLVVIALAVVIGAVSAPKGAQTQSSASLSADASGWAKKNYAQYEDFLDDDADLFDDDAIETFAKYDAQLDYGYGSILGLVSSDSLDGKSMEDERGPGIGRQRHAAAHRHGHRAVVPCLWRRHGGLC